MTNHVRTTTGPLGTPNPSSALAVLTLCIAALAVLFLAHTTSALPEYSTQTGEPCATCHISPSGGGLRTPRGQAWVGGGRPGAVAPLEEALALLGVRLKVDPKEFIALPAAGVAPAQPLKAEAREAAKVKAWLRDYGGN